MACLPCVEIEPATSADAAVIWLHGLGANGHDFEPIVPELRLPPGLAVRFVFPHAPPLPVTINGGMVMPAWYDILDLRIERRVDVAQLGASAGAAQALIEREVERGIDSRRIVLAGFSQGGAVAIEAALTCARPLAGLLVLSGYFATHDTIVPHPASEGLAIQMFHGTRDPIVPETLGRRSCELLRERGYAVEYRSFPMEHGVCVEEIAETSAWLQARLA